MSGSREPLLLLAVMILLAAGLAYLWARRQRRAADANLRALAEIGQAILCTELEVDALCEAVYVQASAIVDTKNFQLGLFHGEDYEIKVWVRDGRLVPGERFPNAAGEGIVGWLRKTQRGLLVSDFKREWDQLPARPRYYATDSPVRSGVFVPLVAGGEAVGALAIQCYRPRAFKDEHLRLLTVLAALAAGIIQTARSFEQERAHARQLQLIAQVTNQLVAIQPLPDLFRQIVDLIHGTFGYHPVSVFMLDRAAGCVRLGASNVLWDDEKIPLGKGLIGWAAGHAEVVHVPDVTRDARFRALAGALDTCAEVALPLLIEDRVLGVLDVQADRVAAFGEDDLDVLKMLAGQLALAIQEAATYDSERRQANRLATMVEASRAMVSILDIDDLLEEVVDLVVDYFGFERVHLFVRSGDRLVFRAGSGVHSGLWRIDRLSYGLDDPGLIPMAARRGAPVVSNDVYAEPDYVPGPAVEDTRAEVSVPIKLGGNLLGVFDVQSLEPDVFSEDDVALVQALADSTAVALRNASLYATEQRRRHLAETLRHVGTVLTSQRELPVVLNGILLALERVVDYDIGLILLPDPATGAVYQVQAALGAPPDALGKAILRAGNVQEEILWWLHDMAGELEQGDERAHDTVVAPLALAGDEVGYLVVDRMGPDGLSEEDRQIVGTFAAQVAVAIANAQLFAAQQEEAWVTTALLQVAEAVNRETDIDAALETVARLTPLLAGVDGCAILRWDAATDSFYGGAVHGLAPEAEVAFHALHVAPEEWSFFVEDAVSAQNVVLLGAGMDAPLPPVLAGAFASPVLMGMPLVAKGSFLGLMLVDYVPVPETGMDDRRFTILAGIVQQTAMAMETARLQAEANERERLERELEVAQEIQTSFLPESAPQIAGWEVATFYRTARQVGGDFYDYFPLASGNWGLVIADVAGKGVPAALFMALCRTLIRVVAISRTSPGATLARVNDLVLADSRADMFVTVFYLVLDPQTGEIHYATAGHNPPLHVSAAGGRAGRAHALEGRGLALGVMGGVEYEEHTERLQPGDVIVLYTDGVTEAVDLDEEEFGMERLTAEAERRRDRSAAEIVSAVADAVDAFAGDQPQFDDLTLVVIKRLSGG
ncbi:MAG: SpoIIE family protein phosphatase [Anaerolineae bacterium]|nr:SpoIIE family protein phosphatase [Anaerolineae bacterium]